MLTIHFTSNSNNNSTFWRIENVIIWSNNIQIKIKYLATVWKKKKAERLNAKQKYSHDKFVVITIFSIHTLFLASQCESKQSTSVNVALEKSSDDKIGYSY